LTTVGELVPREPRLVAAGAVHLPDWLDAERQHGLVASCRRWGEAAGGFRAPRMPRGGAMSVQITCLGWHWFPYRYSRRVEDGDGRAVARFPTWLGRLAREAVRAAAEVEPSVIGGPPGHTERAADGYRPDVALVNWYGPDARMGMHVDREEPSPAPVVSLSVGDSCVFRFGSPAGRGRPWTDLVLESGDLVVFGGPSRRAYHGVPKVFPGTAPPGIGLETGRFNITVRETGLPEAS
jgi:alkylated DNA repair protein (DNA oxidative demethylase)